MRLGKSRSMSSLSSGLSSPSSVSSDYTYRSSWALSSGSSTSINSPKRLLGVRRRKTEALCMRYTCVPCLSGDVNAADGKGRTLLFYAAKYDQIDTIKQLLQAGCDPNKQDCFGKTPLHDAIERGSLEVAKVLIKEGETIDINIRDNQGQTPFMVAVNLGQIEAVRLLHKYGANINEVDGYGTSPVYRAIDGGWNDIAEFLLDHSCDVNIGSASESCFSAILHSDRLCSVQNIKRILKSDYDFKQDADWLETEECPDWLKERTKLYTKVLVKAGLRDPLKKTNSVKSKLIKTLRQLSTTSR